MVNQNTYMGLSQIFILLLSIFSFSYMIYSIDGVSAQVVSKGCCEQTKSGNSCIEVNEDECELGFSKFIKCSETNDCVKGCCVSDKTGICYQSTTENVCDIRGGVWNNDAVCNVNECKKGCCVIGREAFWTTEQTCLRESGGEFADVSINFQNLESEIECTLLSEREKEGACVFESGDSNECVYTTGADCQARGADFHVGFYCSDNALNNSCQEKSSKSCLNGEEDVYWFDSCGNPEGIADDCNLFEGSYCGGVGNTAVCRDISCNVDGVERKNGESWCEYDDVIGQGTDTVGSRHVKHICYMGEERIDACNDYRNEICVEEENQIENGKISQAACRVNNWRSCMNYNNFETSKRDDECSENPDCYSKNINFGTQKFDVCLPEYPPGFDLAMDYNEDIEGYSNSAEDICNLANVQCTQLWEKKLFGSWKCKKNCNCNKEVFTKDMNEFCVSLGDCGAYVNYEGDINEEGYTLRADWKWPPRLSDSKIRAIKNNQGEKPAKPGDLDFLQVSGLGSSLNTNSTFFSGVSGALGSPLLIKILSDRERNESLSLINSVRETRPNVMDFAGFSKSAFIVNEGQIIEDKSNKIMGLDPIGLLAGGIAGAIAGILMGSMIVGLIVGLIVFFFFFSQTKVVNIYFDCHQWQAPDNGDCNKCNEVDVPCTEYRCESLGKECEIVNKGTAYQICIENPRNYSVPVIDSWSGLNNNLPNAGFKYHNEDDSGFELVNEVDNGCIDAFTTVKYGIKVSNTNGEEQFAQCKFDIDSSKTYDEMLGYFDEHVGSAYFPYHRMDLFLPSPEAFGREYNLTEAQMRELGTMEFFVKCRNKKGVVNNNPFKVEVCVNPGPDLTPPLITRTIPDNNAYVKYSQEEFDFNLFINEPGMCRWSEEDVNYELMENEMECQTSMEYYGVDGLNCNSVLPVSENNKFYIRCKDISENENVMQESYVYEISKSVSDLSIDRVFPIRGEDIVDSVEPASTELKLETSGGAVDGKAECSFRVNDEERFTEFFETGDNIHKQNFNYLFRGNYEVEFKCEDVAGNIVNESTRFRVKIDTTGPKIIRAYSEGNELKIITSEDSNECKYGFDKRTRFENMSSMSNRETGYYADWDLKTFYIQCVDRFENKGGVFVVRPYELI